MKTPLSTIKNWFKTGMFPTQSQFWNWMDSFWHKDDPIPTSAVSGLDDLINGKATTEAMDSLQDAVGNLQSDKLDKSGSNADLINDAGYAKQNEIPEIVDNLTSTDVDKTLSANQGKLLKDLIDNFGSAITLAGEFSAGSAVDLPGGMTVAKGDAFVVTSAGTVHGNELSPGDLLIAKVDNPSTTDISDWIVVQQGYRIASEIQFGNIMLASQSEAEAGTDDSKAITALKLAVLLTNYLKKLEDDTTPKLGGNLDAGDHLINNIADPEEGQDAATKSWSENQFPQKASDEDITGDWRFSGKMKDSGGNAGTAGQFLKSDEDGHMVWGTGVSMNISQNGTWVIEGVDTGLKAVDNAVTYYDDAIIGSRNVSNGTYTLPASYIPGSVKLWIDGLRQTPGNGNKDFQELSANDGTIIINSMVTTENKLIVEIQKKNG